MPSSHSRLTYRQPQAADVQRLFAIFGDPQTHLFNPAGPLPNLDAAQRLLDHWLEQWASQGYGWWAIARKEPRIHHRFGGIAPLNPSDAAAHQPWLSPGRRGLGQGYATELGRDALALAFDTLSLPEVFGLVRPDHAASIRVLEKLGMQRFGLLDDVPGQAPSLVLRVCHPTTAQL